MEDGISGEMLGENNTGLNSSSNVELELMLEFIKCPSLVDYTVPKRSDIYPKVPYSNHLKTSLNARMLQSSRYRAVTGKKEVKAEKQKF